MHTVSEVVALLGCTDPRHLAKCMQYAGIDSATLPKGEHDKRQRLLSDAQVERLREVYAHLYATASERHDLDELRAQVAELQQQVAALTATRSAGNLTAHVHSTDYDPPRRLPVTTVRVARTPARPPVPSHLMSLPTWADLHGMKIGTAKTWREKGKLPMVRGQWMEERNGNQTRIDTALTIEGREIAHQLAGILWPCEICSGEDNETPHTAPEQV